MTTKDEVKTEEEEELAKGIAFFWRSSNLEPHIRSVGLSHGVSKISLGTLHTLLLTFSSELYSVGDNSFGQLGLGDLKSRKEPTVIDYFRDKRVQEVACGGQHSGVLCENGDVYFWGDSSSGQCGFGDEKFTCKPTKIQFEHVTECNDHETSLLQTQEKITKEGPVIKQLACGDSHTLAVSTTGEVWSWGTGCQLGHGIETEKVCFPRRIDSLSGKNVIAVVCGAYHSLALVEDSSFPTFMFHRSENVTSQARQKEQRGRVSKKQKKVSKESLKKGRKSGKNQKAKLVSTQQSKSETPLVVSSRKGHSCVTRTYLSYGTATSNGSVQSSLESEKVKGKLTGIPERADGDFTDALQLVDHESLENSKHVPSQPQPIPGSNFKTCSGNLLPICDSYYASPEESVTDKSFDDRSWQTSTLQAQYSLISPEAVFVTADTGEDYALYESSISPGSPLSPASDRSVTYFASTDSDSEESLTKPGTKQELKKPQADRNYSDSVYSGISSRLIRPDVNLGKLTSAVVGSVAGMFTSAVPGHFSSDDSLKPVMGKAPCEKCALLGLCLCDNEDASNTARCKPFGARTQVWTWGRGGCGQLGLGDTEDRSLPCCVKELSDVGVIKMAAGTFHSLAQTIYSQVFSWGDNSCGQLGHKKNIGLHPRKVKCFSEVLIWDIAAGSHYSLFVGDMAVNKPDVYVCGRQPSAMPNVATTMSNIRETRSLPSLATDESSPPAVTQKKEKKRILIPSRSFDDTKERSLQHCRVEIVRLAMFREVGLLRSVTANTERCACLATSDKSGQFLAISELASQERLFYYQLALIWQAVLVPLLQSEVWSCLAFQETGEVLAPIIKSFYILMKCVSSSLVAVAELVKSNRSFHDLFEQCLSSEFLQVLESYSENFSNGVAFGVFAAFSSISSDIASQSRAVLCDIMDTAAQDLLSLDNAFQYMMQVPLLKMQHYKDIAEKLQSVVSEKNVVDLSRLQEVAELWEQLITRDENRQVDAERTQKFWQETPSKITEKFKDCRRRLVRSSNIHSLFPSKSTRFSSHLFLLFDDYFVHSQSQKHFQEHSLATLWADGMDDSEGVLNGIKITTPEEILLLCAPSPADKADWLMAINRAVANVISKTTTYRLGIEAVNVNTGSLVPGSAREAAYTYHSDNRYSGATYHGMWLHGKPHGHGEMHWTDGRHYTGEFKHGLHHGEGIMIFPPNTAVHSGERYEGQWEDGKMSGHGKMRYSNGGTYVGHWYNGQRSGHGSMQCGALSSTGATVYIGEWSSDKKCGYGVMDDILRGEKYMGMWEGDNRHGPGLLVTLDGVYSQGTFVQNKLVGNGVLLCDDNTKFEGEFVADSQLGGKGVLTMPNGDFIDGTFTGRWGDGIRVNGVFYKLETTGMTNSSSSATTTNSKYLIPPEKKWMSLFTECRHTLGCDGDRDAAPETVLNCISMSLVSSRDGQQEVMQELLNTKDATNKYDTEALQAYLSKAFDTKHHPLGHLVNGLIDVFRASYVGMGTHRRLLQHAVAEAKSFVIRVYSLVRLLFPDLLNEEYVHVDTSAVSGVSGHSIEESTASSTLLHPLLFPRLYPPLFTLYALDNERADSAYWERIQQLNKRSDWALMTYVGMKRHFWLTNEHEVGSRSDEVKLENREPKHYLSAIDSLQQISTKFSPMEKLRVLKATFEKINEEVASFWQGEIKLVSLDDLFPVFQFVVIRARIPHLGSEIHFIDDMVDSHVHIGEQGHMFTTLKACFFQIQNEKG